MRRNITSFIVSLLCAVSACTSSGGTPTTSAGAGASSDTNTQAVAGGGTNFVRNSGQSGASGAGASSTTTVNMAPPIAGALGTSQPRGGSAAGQGAAGTVASDSDNDDDAGAPAGPDAGTAAEGEPVICTRNAYVTNSGSNSVSAIDTTTHQVVATIKTGPAPVNPTFTLDRKQLYVSDSQGGTLTIIDVSTHEARSIPASGPAPSGLAFVPGGEKLVVTLLGETVATQGSLTVMTLATGATAPPIPLGAQPERLTLSPDGTRAFVSNLGDGTISIVDLTAGQVIDTLMVGELPFNPLMLPDGSLFYVGVLLSNKILAIDPMSFATVRSIDVNTPNGMAFDLDFKSLYVSNAFAGTVQQVSLETGMVLKSGMVGGLPGHLALLPGGEHFYMVRPDGMTVEVIDTSDLSIASTITVESGPSTVAVCREP